MKCNGKSLSWALAYAVITLHTCHMIGTKANPRTDRYLSGIPFQRTEPIPDVDIGKSVGSWYSGGPTEWKYRIDRESKNSRTEPTETANLSVRSGSGIGSGPTECQFW